MKIIITIRQIIGGWAVTRSKYDDRDNLRGCEELAKTCGGNLGGLLAIEVAKAACSISMADEIELSADSASRFMLDAFNTQFRALRNV